MTEQEAQALLMQGTAIDSGEAAAAADAIAVVAAPGTAPENPDAAALEWLIIPQTFAWALKMIFPEVQAHYTDEAELDLARKIVPVAEKYGWDGPGNAPEIALAFGAIGFSMPAVLAYKARKEAAKANAENAQRQGGQKPDGGGDGS